MANKLVSNIFKFGILILHSFSCGEPALFRLLSDTDTGVDFANKIEENEEFNIEKCIYWYNGGGVAIGDINNDGKPDIYFTANQQSNKLYKNQGEFNFEDITESAGVAGDIGASHWSTGVTMVDINSDGWLDIYVCQLHDPGRLEGGNKLFINNGNGTFTEKAREYGLNAYSYAQQAAFFDFDLDGDLDMFLVNQALRPSIAIQTRELRAVRDSLTGDRLYENQNNRFIDISDNAGIYGGSMGHGLSIVISDINNDNYPDIYVTNDSYENDYLYYNLRDGTFKENINGSMGHSSYFSKGSDMADINNDGLMDIMTLDIKPDEEVLAKMSFSSKEYEMNQSIVDLGYHHQEPRNMLQINRGNLFDGTIQFSEIGSFAGVSATDWSWACLFADFDLDGNKDLFISNGIPHRPIDLDYLDSMANVNSDTTSQHYIPGIALMPPGAMTNRFFKNVGSKFLDKSKSWNLDLEGCSNGAAYSDLDNDGDLDLVVNNLNATASIYENGASDKLNNNYIKVILEGNPGNLLGIGARISIEVSDQKQFQEVSPTRGWLSSVDYHLVFGIGNAQKIDKLEINWKNGKGQVVENLEPNQTIILRYSDAVAMRFNTSNSQKKIFQNITDKSGIEFRHEENNYVDFDYETLIPRMASREGPKITIGDVDGDGLDDFYIGGAKNQPGKIYRQISSDEMIFEGLENDIFYKDRVYEDAESVFFDVDTDGDLDLYVVSGGGEFYTDYTLTDRLYINDGTGHLEKSIHHPQLAFNGSCVVAGDINQDGNDDLFIGGRSVPGSYGKYPRSRILLGDGGGQLYDATSRAFGDNIKLGMVTDAVWLEESKELIVVGDFLPVTILSFRDAKIEEKKLEQTVGWWNTINKADLDGDGDQDLLLGNFGLNSNLQASGNYPVNLYIKDFDNNGSIDPILSYYRKGIEYPYFGRDKIAEQLIAITKEFPSYKSFASSTFQQVFPIEELKGAGRWQAYMFASIYLENKGEGEFVPHILPEDLQITPIYGIVAEDFSGDGSQEILAVGNFYSNQGGIGKLDASYGHYLKRSENGIWKPVEPRDSGFAIYGEARDIKVVLDRNGEKIILVSRNNGSVSVFKAN